MEALTFWLALTAAVFIVVMFWLLALVGTPATNEAIDAIETVRALLEATPSKP